MPEKFENEAVTLKTRQITSEKFKTQKSPGFFFLDFWES